MSTEDPTDPVAVARTLVLAASLILEDASAELVLPPRPSSEQLGDKVQLLEDAATQLQALARAARAALQQGRQ